VVPTYHNFFFSTNYLLFCDKKNLTFLRQEKLFLSDTHLKKYVDDIYQIIFGNEIDCACIKSPNIDYTVNNIFKCTLKIRKRKLHFVDNLETHE